MPRLGGAFQSDSLAGSRWGGRAVDFVRTTTDQEGRYRLVGLPIGADNAILALEESGSMQPELCLCTQAVDDLVEVTIQDNGPGVPPDQRLRIFEPLFIGWRNRRRRAGMGLALAQEIVTEHGGGILIDPDYDRGCRIRLYLRSVEPDD